MSTHTECTEYVRSCFKTVLSIDIAPDDTFADLGLESAKVIQFVWYIFSPVPPPCVLYCTPTRMYLYVPSTHKYKVWYVLPFEWILYGLYGPDLPIVQFKRLIIVMTLESKHPSQAVPEVPVTWTLNSKSSCYISNQSAQFRQMTDRDIFISFYVSHTELLHTQYCQFTKTLY